MKKPWLSNLVTVTLLLVGLAGWIALPWWGLVVLVVALAVWLGSTRDGRLTLAATGIGLSSLPQRWGACSVIIIGIAGVVGVLVAMLAMGEGFKATLDATGSDDTAIILRGGDYLERQKSGNWFDSHIANKAHQGKLSYPGRMDAVHAWAYLPDMARAMVGLAGKRDAFAPFASFGFEGFSITGAELQEAVAQAVGHSVKQGRFPWGLLRVLGLFSPLMREVVEMRYLWDTPHRIDGRALREALPDFAPTPLETAMVDVLTPARSA